MSGRHKWSETRDERLATPEDRERYEEVRAYVSRLWAEDWDSPEDAVYDQA